MLKRLQELQKWNPKIVKVIKVFTIMHKGWELDNTAWIVQMQSGAEKVIFSSGGIKYFAKAKEVQEKVCEYEEGLADLRKAYSSIGKQKNGR